MGEDPQTFVVVGEKNRKVHIPILERHIEHMKKIEIEAEYSKYKNANYDFGLGMAQNLRVE